MAETLSQDITENGVNQGDLIKLLNNIILVANELQADHATFRTEQIAIGTTLADFKAIYDAHVHTADGNASRTSIPDSGSPTGSPSAGSAFSDTPGSPPATLTNNTAIKTTAG